MLYSCFLTSWLKGNIKLQKSYKVIIAIDDFTYTVFYFKYHAIIDFFVFFLVNKTNFILNPFRVFVPEMYVYITFCIYSRSMQY